jgi:hypothetical protein
VTFVAEVASGGVADRSGDGPPSEPQAIVKAGAVDGATLVGSWQLTARRTAQVKAGEAKGRTRRTCACGEVRPIMGG